MSNERYKGLTLDEAAERAGGYVDYNPGRPLVIDADYRAMSKYCKEKGIKPMDLTEEEYGMFYTRSLWFMLYAAKQYSRRR